MNFKSNTADKLFKVFSGRAMKGDFHKMGEECGSYGIYLTITAGVYMAVTGST